VFFVWFFLLVFFGFFYFLVFCCLYSTACISLTR
jgi:hypothetical protein